MNWNHLYNLLGVAINPATEDKQDASITKLDAVIAAIQGDDLIKYEYMGKQEITTYVYYGFKEKEGTDWKVMRKDTADDSAWKYAYSTTEDPPKTWAVAWSNPAALDFDDPPD